MTMRRLRPARQPRSLPSMDKAISSADARRMFSQLGRARGPQLSDHGSWHADRTPDAGRNARPHDGSRTVGPDEAFALAEGDRYRDVETRRTLRLMRHARPALPYGFFSM